MVPLWSKLGATTITFRQKAYHYSRYCNTTPSATTVMRMARCSPTKKRLHRERYMKKQRKVTFPEQVNIIRSNRKTIAIQIDREANVIVRAPLFVSEAEIKRFLDQKEAWIRNNQEKIREEEQALEGIKPLTGEEIEKLADQALKDIPKRVAFYAKQIGVTYGRITIRNQKTRWGSCSSKGNLNFNCLLMLTPPQVIDSVVVHELCHRKEMNHSAKFYEEIYRVYPEYDKWNRWLKENGPMILRRMTG